MILETISYIFHSVSCPRYIKKIGLLQELIAIEARSQRCSKQWSEHLYKTKETLADFSQTANKDSKLLLFGAGLLNDIPLEQLSEAFKEVILVDIFFLQSTINKIRQYPNLGFEEQDITAVLELAYKAYLLFKKDKDLNKFDDRLKNLASIRSNFKLDDDSITHVASVNLLSQLPLSIKNFFESRNIEIGENFYRSLVKNHVDYLRSFSNLGKKVLLISDTEKEVLDLNGKLKLSESSIEGFDLEELGLESLGFWDWNLAPQGELDPKYSLKLKVESGII